MIDVRCFDDLDEFGGEITDPDEALWQDNHHRLITPRGMNIDDDDFGLGIPEMLSGVGDGSIGAKIEDELRKDDRNVSVTATVTKTASGHQGDEYDVYIAIVTDAGRPLARTFELSANGFEPKEEEDL